MDKRAKLLSEPVPCAPGYKKRRASCKVAIAQVISSGSSFFHFLFENSRGIKRNSKEEYGLQTWDAGAAAGADERAVFNYGRLEITRKWGN
jgi:hypothetical protein